MNPIQGEVPARLDYEHGITAVDTGYWRPRLDASHLIVQGGRAAFVDTGTSHSVPALLGALAAKGLAPEAVDYIFLTHIHLDHAGGAGALAAKLPNAKVVVQPRGAQHLAAPEKLIAGTKAVYGEERYAELYGEIVPVAAERIIATEDGQRLSLAGRPFEFIHTPGHALHHHCIVDLDTRGVFTGDTFGLSYREFDVDGRSFILTTTTPTHFDPVALKASMARIMSYAPAAAFLTHYGRITDLARHHAELDADVDAFVAIAKAAAAAHPSGPARSQAMTAALNAHLHARLDAHGDRKTAAERGAILDVDIELNVQGLEVWLGRAA